MGPFRRSATSAVLALALFSSCFGACAADIHLGYAGVEWTTFGDQLKGTLRIEVRNLTGGEIRGVEVGIAHPGIDALERGGIQFAAIRAGDVGVATSGFLFSARADAPLIWRVRYEQGGAGREVMLLGEATGGLQP